jgi:hypothetical protein
MAVIPKNGQKHKSAYSYEYRRKTPKKIKKKVTARPAETVKKENANETGKNQTAG